MKKRKEGRRDKGKEISGRRKEKEREGKLRKFTRSVKFPVKSGEACSGVSPAGP